MKSFIKSIRCGKRTLGFALVMTSSLSLAAMPPVIESLTKPDGQGWCRRAAEMYATGNYAGTIDQLSRYVTTDRYATLNPDEHLRAVMMLLNAYSDCNMQAQFLTLYKTFEACYPLGVAGVEAALLRADFDFFNGQYEAAAQAYATENLLILTPERQSLYTYRLALSLLESGKKEEAEPLFHKLIHVKKYADASQFYLGYIDFLEGRYDDALRRMEKVNSATAKTLGVDFYEAQIRFARGEFATVLHNRARYMAAAERLAESHPQMSAEINRIVGESFFSQGDKENAYPHLMRYLQTSVKAPLPSALYTAGVIEYDRGQYDAAAQHFSRAAEQSPESAIGQSATLYLGQCHAARGDYNAAALAFDRAARMNCDGKVAETALFNHAVASMKGGNVPFASTTTLLENFSTLYPSSAYTPQVESYLATAYFNDRDYSRALQRISRIKHPDAAALASRQRILYELGSEELSNGRTTAAIEHLSEAASMTNVDKKVAADANLWLGDALYRTGEYTRAANAFNRYLSLAPRDDANRPLALYNLAYAMYQNQAYDKARDTFASALKASPSLDRQMQIDARLRMADCDYYNGRVSDALRTYGEVAEKYPGEGDYAAFQHANMQGVAGNHSAKANELRQMVSRYPTSVWLPDALMELTAAEIATGNYDGARAASEQLNRLHPASEQLRRSKLQIAAGFLDADRLDDAAAAYREIITQWPTSRQAEIAVADLKNIATRTGDVAGYASFLASVPGAPRPDADEMERLTFDAAEKRIATDAGDMSLMKKYLDSYPSSPHSPQAWLYLAQHYAKTGNEAEAEKCADAILALSPDGECAPPARLIKAQALEAQGEKGEAFKVWQQLSTSADTDYRADALAGMARTAIAPATTLKYLNELEALAPSEITPALRLLRAKALEAEKYFSQADKEYSSLADNTKSIEGAQAAVELGRMRLERGDAKGAQKVLIDFTDRGTPHSYWLARGYIGLADTYNAQGDKATAKEYLRSLKDNYPGKETDIADMIDSRLRNW